MVYGRMREDAMARYLGNPRQNTLTAFGETAGPALLRESCRCSCLSVARNFACLTVSERL